MNTAIIPRTPAAGACLAPLPPPRVPDHELLRRIGRGAYGEVWLARSVLGAYRAVKIVHRASFDHDRPFEREFEGIQKFEPISRRHDSQVDILHVGRTDDCFYYVMELADDQATGGQVNPDNYTPRTLKSDLMFRSRLPFEECLQIGIALATALEHLHGHGLVHRDIKPSNIIFVNGVPKLADIGLVTGTDSTRSYVGTEGFLPPEGTGTPQGDLYSLGKVLYEAATGKDRQEFPELPTGLRELPDREGLIELNAVIARACRHDPKDRYVSAAAMRADLELLQSGKSLARLHWTEAKLRFVQRAGAAVTAVAALIAAGWLWQARQTHLVRDLAEQKTRIFEEKGKLAEQNRDQVLQLNLANGVRNLEEGDLGSAMLWFAEALKKASGDPARVELHRFRLSALLKLHPMPLATIQTGRSLSNEVADVDITFDREGTRFLLAAPRRVELWELAAPPRRLLTLPDEDAWPNRELSPDGQRVVFSSRKLPGQEIWTVDASGKVQVTKMDAGVLKHVRFALGGQCIMGVNTNGALLMFEAATGQLLREVDRFELPVANLTFSPNHEHVAVMLTNHVVRVLDLATGSLVGNVPLGDAFVLSLLDATGRFVVSKPANLFPQRPNGEARIWEVTTGRIIGAPLRHTAKIVQIQGSSDGRLVVTTGQDRFARLWNQFTGDSSVAPLPHKATVVTAALSPDNARVVTGDIEGTVIVWDAKTGKPLTPPLAHGTEGLQVQVKFALGGSVLVTSSSDGLVRLWSLASPLRAALLRSSISPAAVRFSPDGELLLLNGSASSEVWRTLDWQLIATIAHTSGRSETARFSADSRYLAINDRKGARVWDARSGTAAGPLLTAGEKRLWGMIAFSPDSATLATAEEGGMVRRWDWRTGREAAAPLQHTGRVFTIAYSPQGDRLLTGGFNGEAAHMWLWDLNRDILVRDFEQRPSRFGLVVQDFDPAGSKWIASDVNPLAVKIRDALTGKSLSALLLHKDTIWSARFSPDSKRMVTGSADRTARIWDGVTGESLLPPLRHPAQVVDTEFSPDGRLVVTRTADGALQLWDSMSGLPLTPSLPLAAGGFAWHPDSRRLAVIAPDRHVLIDDFGADFPADELDALVRLMTGRALKADGTVQPVPGAKLVELDQQLRHLQPNLFMLAEEQRARWHEWQVVEHTHLDGLATTLYHLDRLRELQPTNQVFQALRRQLAARLLPPRDPTAPARLIELTDHYTHSLDSLKNQELAELPRGRQRLAGTDFDIRGVIKLAHADAHGINLQGYSRISYIRVAQHCHRLQFLQATDGDDEIEGEEAARFVIHYADGSQRIQPMVFGRHLRNWWHFKGTPREVSDAVIAWEGQCDIAARRGATIRLFKGTWENPTPEVEVSHLEFEIGNTPPRLIVIAITAE